MSEGSVIGVLFNLLLYVILIFSFYNKQSFKSSINRKFIVISCGVLFCLWPFYAGDYYHYQEDVEKASFESLEWSIEPVYIWIIDIFHRNYFIFRIIVWIGGLFLYREALFNLGFRSIDAFLIALLMCLPSFAGARAYPAMIVFIYGISVIFKNRNCLFYKIGGCAICLSSIAFHKQCAVLMIIFLISLFFKPSWIKVIISLVIIGIILKTLQSYFDLFLFTYQRSEEVNMASAAGNKISYYATQDSSYKFSASGSLNFIFGYLPIFYGIIYYLKHVNSFESLPFLLSRFARMLPITFIAFTAIVLVVKEINPLSMRVLGMANVPLAILVIYGYKNDWRKKFSKICLRLTIMFYLWLLVYQCYCNLIS